MKQKIIYLPLAILTVTTATAGVILLNGRTLAAPVTNSASGTSAQAAEVSSSATATITIPDNVCTFTGNDSMTQTEQLVPGQLKASIGEAQLIASCNDTSTHSVYARGYSNDEAGNTNMIMDNNNTFPTGLETDGDTSQWAMVVVPDAVGNIPLLNDDGTAGTCPANAVACARIADGFRVYHAIPTASTEIATFQAATAAQVGMKSYIDPRYRVYVSPTQAAGTYTGKVKYSLASL